MPLSSSEGDEDKSDGEATQDESKKPENSPAGNPNPNQTTGGGGSGKKKKKKKKKVQIADNGNVSGDSGNPAQQHHQAPPAFHYPPVVSYQTAYESPSFGSTYYARQFGYVYALRPESDYYLPESPKSDEMYTSEGTDWVVSYSGWG